MAVADNKGQQIIAHILRLRHTANAPHKVPSDAIKYKMYPVQQAVTV